MSIQHIDGFWMEKMVSFALASLKEHEREVNDMNVFPVPDGDTGTNMLLTLQGAFSSTSSDKHLGRYIGNLASNALMNARGNSGVILSQLISGFAGSLKRCSIANARECANAMINAYKKAYSAVERPVEGTILTVARSGADNASTALSRQMSVDVFFSLYLSEIKKAQLLTPELLPSLKDAGVCDSGAQGWIYLVEGFVKCLYGNELPQNESFDNESEEDIKALNALSTPSLEFFNAESSFELGYCLEFILQLMDNEPYARRFNKPRFVKAISEWGNSIVCVQDGSRVKVHVHTKKPSHVISAAQQYGEFVSFKLENMDAQAAEQKSRALSTPALVKTVAAEHKEIAFVCVADGMGLAELMKEADADIVLDGGAGMNTPAGDFLKAFDKLNATQIVVMPNNPNIVQAATQAVNLSSRTNVMIIPTRDQLEGLAALSMDVPNLDNESRIRLMKEGIEGHRTLFATRASRSCCVDGVDCQAGEFLVILNDTVLACEKTPKLALERAFAKIEDKEDLCLLAIYSGNEVEDALVGEVCGILEELCPDAEVVERAGEQHIYDFMIEIQ